MKKCIYDINDVQCGSCYQLKRDCYNYKLFYVSPMLTTKTILSEDTLKKIKKESKHVTTKNKQKHKTKQ